MPIGILLPKILKRLFEGRLIKKQKVRIQS
jgi:hypothetical protein